MVHQEVRRFGQFVAFQRWKHLHLPLRYQINNELTENIQKLINKELIKNTSDIPIYKKLFNLLNESKSIKITSYFATKIEKDLIIMRFKNKIKLLQKNNTNFNDDQTNYLKNILNIDIVNDITLFSKYKFDKLIEYIQSDKTSIDDVLQIKKSLIDEKTGGNITKKVCNIILYIIIILLLLIIILICLYGLYIICDKTYCMCTNNNNNGKKILDNNVNIT
jgi:hypothetical protein